VEKIQISELEGSKVTVPWTEMSSYVP